MENRVPTRTYLSKAFRIPHGRDQGQLGRFIYKVFDEPTEPEDDSGWKREMMVISTSAAGRTQLRLNVAKEAGVVREIVFQRAHTADNGNIKEILKLDRIQSQKLIELIRVLDHIPVEGAKKTLEDDTLQALINAPESLREVYEQDPDILRELVESDATAEDIIALQRRKEVVETMHSWLEDESVFSTAADRAGGKEKAWQRLLEANPWVLGIGLGGQLYTSWVPEKLEQSVVGHKVNSAGKIVDALLETNGAIRSMAFAEIKHHKTPLLKQVEKSYRSGVWAMSDQFSGAVIQAQQTVHLAVGELEETLPKFDSDGARTGETTYVVQPRSFLIIGVLDELKGESGGVNDSKLKSFELFRRNLASPEVLTFDELVARAEWHVRLAEAGTGQTKAEELGF
ncbi:hypothetical protein FRC0337_01614 [Corynebacterium diphtheriae]|nr:hypothetical protein CIP101841_01727 [Corynebacterium diphtheriae]CAB0852788.1 hypothetical protein FRC0337_01614 [Corynebacterium diphtheriae]CAB1020843.1 hypothetical protein FRC0515_01763 [Corynebacterium diphtheriae]CAB1045222.1 hypothetical protein FRC0547_01820 [Corynebacterium diphtheriae]